MMAQRISSLTSDQLIMSAAAPPPPPPLLEPTTNMTSPNHKKEEDETKANNEEAVVVVVEKPIMARRSARQCNILMSTRHLSRLNQLFWKTDHRTNNNNNRNMNGAGPPRTRKRKKLQENETISLGRLVLQTVHSSPHIYMIDNFLTEAELLHCDSIIDKSKFAKSFVDNSESTSTEIDTQHRTSTFVSVAKQADSKISAMERKSAELLGLSVHQMEPLQLVRYRQDQFFGVHHDLGNLRDDGSIEMPTKQAYCKRRLATIFVYLNDVADGGCTLFPACDNLRVTPKRGRAVLFCNILKTGDADPNTIHAGEPVRGKGNVKYGLNIWACED